jgi:hypothetical protein
MTMSSASRGWPRGTGQWSRTRILVVASDDERRDRLLNRWGEAHDVVGATTPLEVIDFLESEGTLISTVVLAGVGGSANDKELASFVDQNYPWVRLIVGGIAVERWSEPWVAPGVLVGA